MSNLYYGLTLVLLGLVTIVTALYDSNPEVVELTEANFQYKVIDSDDLWLVEFFAPWCGHCKSLAPEYKKAAKALKGIVKVGAVNMDEHRTVGEPYNVKGFPTLKFFSVDKSKPEDYQGQRNAQGMVDAAIQKLKSVVNARLAGKQGSGSGSGGGGGDSSGGSSDVIVLTDSNFDQQVVSSPDMWLVEFYAPWCGHCKKLTPEWAKAATELKGKVKVAMVDATENTILANRFGIQGFPTIKYFPSGDKGSLGSSPPVYEGGRTASDIVSWALDHLADSVPAPELIQITDTAVLEQACDTHQLCVVSFLPHILDSGASGRNQYLEMIRDLSERYKKRMWGWVWSEAGAQSHLEDAVGIGGFGYPAMAALNVRKNAYALLRGSFSEDGIGDFLRELAVGRGGTMQLQKQGLPPVDTIEQWDGLDGQLPIEEDIDLSDVDFDEGLTKEEL